MSFFSQFIDRKKAADKKFGCFFHYLVDRKTFFRFPAYTAPWASIAWATFSKPAMLAPATRSPSMPYFLAAA